MKNIYAPYLTYKKLNGFSYQTKFLKELNFKYLIENNGFVESHYGEKIKVTSVVGAFEDNKIIFIEDNKPVLLSTDFIVKEATINFKYLLNEAVKANYMDYKRYENDLTFKEKVILILKNLNLELNIEKEEFDEDKYLNFAKNISHLSLLFLNDTKKENYLKEISKIVKIVNTFLAKNGSLKISPDDSLDMFFNIDKEYEAEGIVKYYFISREQELDNYIEMNSFKLMNKVDGRLKIKVG